MMTRQVLLLGVCLGLLAGIACATLVPPPTPTPTLTLTLNPAPVFTTSGPNLKATKVAQTAVAVTATAEKVAPSQTALIASAWAAATEIAQNSEKRATEYVITRLAIETRSMLKMTATAEPFAERVRHLVAQGYLTTAEGQYKQLFDFKESFARTRFYNWYPTDETPTDFVIRTEVTWDSASDKADWSASGCGFVFRANGDDRKGFHYYMAYLSLDGMVSFGRTRGDKANALALDEYGEVAVPSGHATLMLVVEGIKFTLFVDDQPVSTIKDGALVEGDLGFMILSGTSQSFGTRCTMEQVELWTIK